MRLTYFLCPRHVGMTYMYVLCLDQVGKTSSSSSQHLHTLHLQQRIHGAAKSKKGEATNSNTPKPANIPTTYKKNNVQLNIDVRTIETDCWYTINLHVNI